MNKKYVYLFSEGDGSMRELLGGKGANLAEMTILGMPVPQGFTVTTQACNKFYEDDKKISPELEEEILTNISKIEKSTGKNFGDQHNPLLISVRSGARASMPGMMDTILNLGLNDMVVNGLASITNNERFAYDSYRRFIQMFSDVVMELPKCDFEKFIDEMKKAKGYELDTELTVDDLKELVLMFKDYYKRSLGKDFPQEPKEQLIEAVKAVFRSWDNERANVYRRMNDIPHSWGTAVNVQTMVFGNTGNNSGTGVAFTRNPATGEKDLFGEFLINAQGEDVVAGVRTPQSIDQLKSIMPHLYDQFADIAKTLENHYRDMQDMEFTIEDGKLYMLQTRNGKRTAAAALKIAVDMVREGKITEEEAVLRVDPKQLEALLHSRFDEKALKSANQIGEGLAASPGAASGMAVFSAEDAKKYHENGDKVVLVRLETSPEDIEGMNVAEGILTARGGMTSHAAVVARGMGACCVSGCSDITFNSSEDAFTLGGETVSKGDYISIDGSTGKIYKGEIPTVPVGITGDFELFMKWADERREMKVFTNADNPKDAKQAVEFGAEGIGLCRTEHMFFGKERIKSMREMIVAKTKEDRIKALNKLLPFQQSDFEKMYRVMQGRPMAVRLLDPPLHEFLPKGKKEISEIACELNISEEELKSIIVSLHEFNPMMGHRGCRLAVSYPEIAQMQTTAIINAAIKVNSENLGYKVEPEIMIPLVGNERELKFVKDIIDNAASSIIETSDVELEYTVGTMIEIPRAVFIADKIAEDSEFISFGTNDLTQLAMGFSRDDAGKFLDVYYKNNIYEFDPFQRLDVEGVGKLVDMAVKLSRSIKPNIKLGVCGEHGGDTTSIAFCNSLKMSYVSCSPYRVPAARLAAAHAAIQSKTAKGSRLV